MRVVLPLVVAAVVVVLALALGVGALARRADRRDEEQAVGRARVRWAVRRHDAVRRSRGSRRAAPSSARTRPHPELEPRDDHAS